MSSLRAFGKLRRIQIIRTQRSLLVGNRMSSDGFPSAMRFARRGRLIRFYGGFRPFLVMAQRQLREAVRGGNHSGQQTNVKTGTINKSKKIVRLKRPLNAPQYFVPATPVSDQRQLTNVRRADCVVPSVQRWRQPCPGTE